MKLNRKPEVILERCKTLESMGFEIHHDDIAVRVFNDFLSDDSIIVDFSAIAEDKFLEYAIKKVFEYGVEKGRRDLKTELKSLLSVEEEK